MFCDHARTVVSQFDSMGISYCFAPMIRRIGANFPLSHIGPVNMPGNALQSLQAAGRSIFVAPKPASFSDLVNKSEAASTSLVLPGLLMTMSVAAPPPVTLHLRECHPAFINTFSSATLKFTISSVSPKISMSTLVPKYGSRAFCKVPLCNSDSARGALNFSNVRFASAACCSACATESLSSSVSLVSSALRVLCSASSFL